jgi:hypothetical protein
MLGRTDHNIYNPLPSLDQQGVDKATFEKVQEKYVVQRLRYALSVMADGRRYFLSTEQSNSPATFASIAPSHSRRILAKVGTNLSVSLMQMLAIMAKERISKISR